MKKFSNNFLLCDVQFDVVVFKAVRKLIGKVRNLEPVKILR